MNQTWMRVAPFGDSYTRPLWNGRLIIQFNREGTELPVSPSFHICGSRAKHVPQAIYDLNPEGSFPICPPCPLDEHAPSLNNGISSRSKDGDLFRATNSRINFRAAGGEEDYFLRREVSQLSIPLSKRAHDKPGLLSHEGALERNFSVKLSSVPREDIEVGISTADHPAVLADQLHVNPVG